jgi:glutaredoxin
MTYDGLVIYSRRDCGLCERMEAAVREVAGPGARISLVDIDDVPALAERFGRDVPVLCLDGEVVCKHFLDAARLRSALDAG